VTGRDLAEARAARSPGGGDVIVIHETVASRLGCRTWAGHFSVARRGWDATGRAISKGDFTLWLGMARPMLIIANPHSSTTTSE
jgi:hypothetical protein